MELKMENTVNGDLTIYGFDSKTTDALLMRETKAKKEYVVAWNFDFEKGDWGQGHYFNQYEDAEKFYYDRIMEKQKENINPIKEAELVLLKNEMDIQGINCSEKELEDMYQNVILYSSEKTLINETDFDNCVDYLLKKREMNEKAEEMEK